MNAGPKRKLNLNSVSAQNLSKDIYDLMESAIYINSPSDSISLGDRDGQHQVIFNKANFHHHLSNYKNAFNILQQKKDAKSWVSVLIISTNGNAVCLYRESPKEHNIQDVSILEDCVEVNGCCVVVNKVGSFKDGFVAVQYDEIDFIFEMSFKYDASTENCYVFNGLVDMEYSHLDKIISKYPVTVSIGAIMDAYVGKEMIESYDGASFPYLDNENDFPESLSSIFPF